MRHWLTVLLLVPIGLFAGCQSPRSQAVKSTHRAHMIVGAWQNVRADEQLVFLPGGLLPDRSVDQHGEPLPRGEWGMVGDHLMLILPDYRGGDFAVTRYRVEALTPSYMSLIAYGGDTYSAKHYSRLADHEPPKTGDFHK